MPSHSARGAQSATLSPDMKKGPTMTDRTFASVTPSLLERLTELNAAIDRFWRDREARLSRSQQSQQRGDHLPRADDTL